MKMVGYKIQVVTSKNGGNKRKITIAHDEIVDTSDPDEWTPWATNKHWIVCQSPYYSKIDDCVKWVVGYLSKNRRFRTVNFFEATSIEDVELQIILAGALKPDNNYEVKCKRDEDNDCLWYAM